MSEELSALKRRLQEIAGPDVYFEPSDWHRHSHPDRSLGGWVHKHAGVGENVHIDPEAVVCGGSALKTGVRIEGSSFIGPFVYIGAGSVIVSSHVAVFEKNVYKFIDYDARGLNVDESHLKEADVIADGAICKSVLGEGVRMRGESVYIDESTLDRAAEVIGSKPMTLIGPASFWAITRVTKSTVTDGAKIGPGVEFLHSRAAVGAVIDQPRTIQGEHVSDQRYALPPPKERGLVEGAPFPKAWAKEEDSLQSQGGRAPLGSPQSQEPPRQK